MCVDFKMLTTENGEHRARRLVYLLDGRNLIERNYDTRTQITRQVLKPGEKVNLLKLGEGPFPLPIGQERAEVLKQFNVQKAEPKTDDPPDSLHIILTPVPNTPFAKQFQTIDVWVDRNTHWPKKISTTDPNQTTERTTELKQVEVNPELTDKDFDLGPLPDGWNRQDEQFQQ
jgi:outer membrane lipoprotein-sorting protein